MQTADLPKRLSRIPTVLEPNLELEVQLAGSFKTRLLGLSFMPLPQRSVALLFNRTRSIHTFGMRFELDLIWLDSENRVVRFDHSVPPRRVCYTRKASSVVELPSRYRLEPLQIGQRLRLKPSSGG